MRNAVVRRFSSLPGKVDLQRHRVRSDVIFHGSLLCTRLTREYPRMVRGSTGVGARFPVGLTRVHAHGRPSASLPRPRLNAVPGAGAVWASLPDLPSGQQAGASHDERRSAGRERESPGRGRQAAEHEQEREDRHDLLGDHLDRHEPARVADTVGVLDDDRAHDARDDDDAECDGGQAEALADRSARQPMVERVHDLGEPEIAGERRTGPRPGPAAVRARRASSPRPRGARSPGTRCTA